MHRAIYIESSNTFDIVKRSKQKAEQADRKQVIETIVPASALLNHICDGLTYRALGITKNDSLAHLYISYTCGVSNRFFPRMRNVVLPPRILTVSPALQNVPKRLSTI